MILSFVCAWFGVKRWWLPKFLQLTSLCAQPLLPARIGKRNFRQNPGRPRWSRDGDSDFLRLPRPHQVQVPDEGTRNAHRDAQLHAADRLLALIADPQHKLRKRLRPKIEILLPSEDSRSIGLTLASRLGTELHHLLANQPQDSGEGSQAALACQPRQAATMANAHVSDHLPRTAFCHTRLANPATAKPVRSAGEASRNRADTDRCVVHHPRGGDDEAQPPRHAGG